jgi:hypothetical protein
MPRERKETYVSNQLVPVNQQQSSLAPATAGQALSLQDKLRYCEWLSKADMLPANYAGKPGNVLVAMELGETLGLAPVVTILELYLVNNRPSISAKLMAALTRRAGHQIRTVGDEKQATCTITRRDTQEQTVLTFTLADAEKAGLAGKDMWKKYPKRMLENRAISACVRLACPEVTMAVAQTPDELGDDGRVEQVTAEFIPERVTERPAEEPGTAKSYGNIKVSEAQPAPERKPRQTKKAAEQQEQQAPPAEEPPTEQPKSQAQTDFEASLPENDPKPANVQQINDAWEAFKKVEGFDPETGEQVPGRDKQRLEELFGITSLRSLTVGQVEQIKTHLAAMAATF